MPAALSASAAERSPPDAAEATTSASAEQETPPEYALESIKQLIGAWASSEADCTKLFQRRGKALAFRQPVDQFAQAAIVELLRIRLPSAVRQVERTFHEGGALKLDAQVPAPLVSIEGGEVGAYDGPPRGHSDDPGHYFGRLEAFHAVFIGGGLPEARRQYVRARTDLTVRARYAPAGHLAPIEDAPAPHRLRQLSAMASLTPAGRTLSLEKKKTDPECGFGAPGTKIETRPPLSASV